MVGFLASTAAVVMGWIPDGELDWGHTLLLCASSVVTASLASLILGKSPRPHPPQSGPPRYDSLLPVRTRAQIAVLSGVSAVGYAKRGRAPGRIWPVQGCDSGAAACVAAGTGCVDRMSVFFRAVFWSLQSNQKPCGVLCGLLTGGHLKSRQHFEATFLPYYGTQENDCDIILNLIQNAIYS